MMIIKLIYILFVFLIGAVVGAMLAYHLMFSPKAMIKRLWKEIMDWSKVIGGMESSGDSVAYSHMIDNIEKGITKRKNVIIALMAFLDPDKDAEFIEQHKP